MGEEKPVEVWWYDEDLGGGRYWRREDRHPGRDGPKGRLSCHRN